MKTDSMMRKTKENGKNRKDFKNFVMPYEKPIVLLSYDLYDATYFYQYGIREKLNDLNFSLIMKTAIW